MANTIFYNADYVVVEYIDLIKSPYLILLAHLRKNQKIKEILKIEEIEFLSDRGLYEWYKNRKHQNFLMDLNRYPNEINEETLNLLLEDQLNISDEFYKQAILLPLGEALKIMKVQKLANDIIIYYPHNNSFAKNDLDHILQEKFTFMSDFDKILDIAQSNSTYFLSNIDLLNKLKEKDYLKFSSVTLPFEYRYNKKNMKEFKINLDELFKEQPFKYSFMYACSRIIRKG